MSTEAELKIMGDSVVSYLECAKMFLEKAEKAHCQPLYYDEEGNYIDLCAEVDRQIAEVIECYKNGGVIMPD